MAITRQYLKIGGVSIIVFSLGSILGELNATTLKAHLADGTTIVGRMVDDGTGRYMLVDCDGKQVGSRMVTHEETSETCAQGAVIERRTPPGIPPTIASIPKPGASPSMPPVVPSPPTTPGTILIPGPPDLGGGLQIQ